MFTLFRFFMLMFAVLSVVFVSLWLYLRAGRQEKAEAEWTRRGQPGSRDRFVALALAAQRRRLLVRLALFVYALPLATLASIVYLVNQR